MKFKTGDRVRVIESTGEGINRIRVGEVGVVEDVAPYDALIKVKFEDETFRGGRWFAKRFELVSPEPVVLTDEELAAAYREARATVIALGYQIQERGFVIRNKITEVPVAILASEVIINKQIKKEI